MYWNCYMKSNVTYMNDPLHFNITKETIRQIFKYYYVSPSNEGRHCFSLIYFFFRFRFFSAKLVRTITFLSFQIGQLYLVCGCMTIRRSGVTLGFANVAFGDFCFYLAPKTVAGDNSGANIFIIKNYLNSLLHD